MTQPGVENRAEIDQDGQALKAQIDNNGKRNDSTIVQSATEKSSEAAITTDSGADDNLARIEQTDGNTKAQVSQISEGNEARITPANGSPQNGSTTADIDQSGGTGNIAEIDQGGAGYTRKAKLAQNGNRNEAYVDQLGTGNGISDQRGYNLGAEVVQDGTATSWTSARPATATTCRSPRRAMATPSA